MYMSAREREQVGEYGIKVGDKGLDVERKEGRKVHGSGILSSSRTHGNSVGLSLQ